MTPAKLQKTWGEGERDLKYSRWANIALVISNLLLVGMLSFQDQIVVLQPPRIVEEMRVGSNHADDTFHKEWGLFATLMIGNVSPGSADMVKNGLEWMLAPSIYSEIEEALNQQVQTIKKGQMTLSFEANSVTFDPATKRVYVTGKSTLRAPGVKPAKTTLTFEYEIAVVGYQPRITHFDKYKGSAKTPYRAVTENKGAKQ